MIFPPYTHLFQTELASYYADQKKGGTIKRLQIKQVYMYRCRLYKIHSCFSKNYGTPNQVYTSIKSTTVATQSVLYVIVTSWANHNLWPVIYELGQYWHVYTKHTAHTTTTSGNLTFLPNRSSSHPLCFCSSLKRLSLHWSLSSQHQEAFQIPFLESCPIFSGILLSYSPFHPPFYQQSAATSCGLDRRSAHFLRREVDESVIFRLSKSS